MKFLKPKKIPSKILKFLYQSYCWGYDDCNNKEKKKTFSQVKKSLNRGYEEGTTKTKN